MTIHQRSVSVRTAALVLCAILLVTHAQPPLPPVPTLPPNPLEGVVSSLKGYAAEYTVQPSNLTRADYLTTIQGIVDWFVPHQNASGAIIDPGAHEEIEYSTPCFALAAATLYTAAGRQDLLAPAQAALSWSIHSLATSNCATGHCDFFALPVMRTFEMLTPYVSPSVVQGWEAQLKSIPLGTWEFPNNNWELTAAAGEYDRIVKHGWSSPSLNWTFWESRIGRLATVYNGREGFWGPEGTFDDNAGQDKVSPMAYDAFGSTYVAVLLAEGYNATGYYAPYLAPMMERGVWSHAAYQSPLGEQPVGGRSNQHQFAEATLCAVAELYAARARESGDNQSACQLKRAAHLYHSSVRRWRRPDNAIQILKNRFLDYNQRFGYMSYSFFSNYNLLPASWLALAYQFADESIPECASLADVGGAAFALASNDMRKVFASVAGTYIEIMTGADPEFDASGLNRFHFDSCSLSPRPSGSGVPCRTVGVFGPSQAPGLEGNTDVSSGRPQKQGAPLTQVPGLSTGAFWSFNTDKPGTRRTLANNTLQTIYAAVLTTASTNSPSAGVSFSLSYVLWDDGVLVEEDYFLPPTGGEVNITATLSMPGPSALFRIMADASAAHDNRRVFYSPPANGALAAAVLARDETKFTRMAGLPASDRSFATMGIQFPAFLFDGTTNFTVAGPGVWSPNTVLVQTPTPSSSTDDGSLAFNVVPSKSLTWTYDPTVTVPSRNGIIAPVYAETAVSTSTPHLSYSLKVVPWQKL